MTFDVAWEVEHQSRPWGMDYDPRVAAFIWKEFGGVKNKLGIHILDVGCGVGAQSYGMAGAGYRVTGIDASPSAIQRARNGCPPPNLDFAVVDVMRMTCPDNVFDAVIDAACLECLSDAHVLVALAEVRRVLKPGGILFSLTKSSEWVQIVNITRDGLASRTSDEAAIKATYGAVFPKKLTYRWERYHDAAGQEVPQWLVECTKACGS